MSKERKEKTLYLILPRDVFYLLVQLKGASNSDSWRDLMIKIARFYNEHPEFANALREVEVNE